MKLNLKTLTREQVIAKVKEITGLSVRTIDKDIKRHCAPISDQRTRPVKYAANAPWVILNSRGIPVAAKKLAPPDAVARLVIVQADGSDKTIRRALRNLKGKATR